MPNQNLTRRRFLASAGLAAVGGVALEAAYFGPRRLSVTRHALGSPGAFDPIRLAVITDLHLKGVDDLHESLATSLRAADPNCIVLVGDSIDSPEGLPLLSEFLDLLPAEPSRFATLGNWEHWSGVSVDDLRRTYAASSTRLLVNEGVEVETHAHVFGTDDSLAGSPTRHADSGDLGAHPWGTGQCCGVGTDPPARQWPLRGRMVLRRRSRPLRVAGHRYVGDSLPMREFARTRSD